MPTHSARRPDGLTWTSSSPAAIFLVAYALIASERFDRTLVALLGGLLVVALGVIDQEEAFAAIDFNVIFLLAGMMVLAGGLSQTGFFEYVAGTPSTSRAASRSGCW